MSQPMTTAAGYAALKQFIADCEDKESSLLKVLYKAQHIFGYLSKETMLFISENLGVPVSKVYGVVSFYSYFTTKPKGRYQIKICMGTACFVRGSEKILQELEKQLGIKNGETTEDKRFSLESLRCVGACGLAPVVLVNDDVHGKITVDDVQKLIHTYEGRSA